MPDGPATLLSDHKSFPQNSHYAIDLSPSDLMTRMDCGAGTIPLIHAPTIEETDSSRVISRKTETGERALKTHARLCRRGIEPATHLGHATGWPLSSRV